MNHNTTLSLDDMYRHLSFGLRSMFYLVTPNETYMKTKEDVPNLPVNSLFFYFWFISIEQLIHIAKHGKINGSMSDCIASVSAGMFSIIPNFIFRGINIVLYEWVYDNFHFFDIPWDSFWTYLVMLLLVDMTYYWLHRAGHEVNIFWAGHQVHHSSEEYNFTTALRQSAFFGVSTSFFYLPLAFFARPSVFLIHSHLNLVYQFWIHTEMVESCGPLEYIINTPSHHRVHHGRNPYCIDKNYAGVLIIWDRMFGTFEAERKDEKIAYGLVHPIETYNPVTIQFFVYADIFKRAFKAKSIGESLSILFMGPGWEPGSPRLGYPDQFPKIENTDRVLSKPLSPFFFCYSYLHYMFVVLFFAAFPNFLEVILVIFNLQHF